MMEETWKITNGKALLNERFSIPEEMYNRLFPHQRKGIEWLWNLHSLEDDMGGLLGDDMGLGKTIQIVCFVSGLFENKLARNALIVVPASVIQNWIVSFRNWTDVRVKAYSSKSKRGNSDLLLIKHHGGVCITSYQLLVHRHHEFQSFRWDYIILDEGHVIKNSRTKTAKALKSLHSKKRLLLTGTPIQNSYQEFWSLFDFLCKGSLLGTLTEFKTMYANPILKSMEKSKNPLILRKGEDALKTLHDTVKPFLLRRKKSTVFKKLHDSDGNNCPILKSKKFDLAIWIPLTGAQVDTYSRLIQNVVIDSKKDVLKYITKLRATCTLSTLGDRPAAELNALSKNELLPLVSLSSKLSFIIFLLERLYENGNRVIIFTETIVSLNIIEALLESKCFKFLRIDGSVKDTDERQQRVDKFNEDRSIFVFLSTIRVGGVGLTITGADRVIIVDLQWNPTVDEQAVDRAYRLGQTKDVVTYRLITCGTVEEKLYKMQVLKSSMQASLLQGYSQASHFTLDQIKELFRFEGSEISHTCDSLSHMKDEKMKSDLIEHIQEIKEFPLVYGVSLHHLMNPECEGEEDPLFLVSKPDKSNKENDKQLFNNAQISEEIVDVVSIIEDAPLKKNDQGPILVEDSGDEDSFHTARESVIELNDSVDILESKGSIKVYSSSDEDDPFPSLDQIYERSVVHVKEESPIKETLIESEFDTVDQDIESGFDSIDISSAIPKDNTLDLLSYEVEKSSDQDISTMGIDLEENSDAVDYDDEDDMGSFIVSDSENLHPCSDEEDILSKIDLDCRKTPRQSLSASPTFSESPDVQCTKTPIRNRNTQIIDSDSSEDECVEKLDHLKISPRSLVLDSSDDELEVHLNSITISDDNPKEFEQVNKIIHSGDYYEALNRLAELSQKFPNDISIKGKFAEIALHLKLL